MLTAATRQRKTKLNFYVWYLVIVTQLHLGRWFVLRDAPDWMVDVLVKLYTDIPPSDEIEFQMRDEAEAEQRLRNRRKK